MNDNRSLDDGRPAPSQDSLCERGSQDPARAAGGDSNAVMEQLLDTELEATLCFGERQMLLQEILTLDSGSVVEFNQQIRQDVELLVGGKVFARGEVVVVDGNYGMRVTEILGSRQREKLLMGQNS